MSSDDGSGLAVDAAGSGLVGVADLMVAVNNLDPQQSEGVLIEQIGALERLKATCAAAQARLTHAFAASQTADASVRHVHPDSTRRSVAAQIALARRESRHHGQRHVGAAHALVTDMPATMAALAAGEISERRARIIIDQFACLTPAGRAHADQVIAAELPGLGDRTAQSRAAGIAYRIDPEAVMGKIRGATKDRHVTLRPAPETMTRLSALLPVAQGVAVYAALRKTADTATAAGDPRTRGQVMADELTSRITGHSITGCDPYGAPHYSATGEHTDDETGANADAGETTGVGGTTASATTAGETAGTGGATGSAAGTGGLEVNLIMTDRTLLGDDDEPAQLLGHGPIPAQLARSLVIGNAGTTTKTWAKALHRPDRHPTGRDGLPAAAFPCRGAEVSDPAGSDLSHLVVRRADPAHRPRHPVRSRRTHPHQQRARPVSSLQFEQTRPPLAEPDRPQQHRAHHHPHRPLLHQQPTTAAQIPTMAGHLHHRTPPRGITSRHRVTAGGIREFVLGRN